MIKLKKRCVVFYVYTREEAIFATRYAASHPQEIIKIIAATISALLLIYENSRSTSDVDELYEGDRDYFKSHIQKFQKKTQDLYIDIRKKLKPFNIYQIDLIEVMKLLIEEELLDVLYAFDLFQTIEKKWQPDLYYFPNDLSTGIVGWESPNFASAALMKEFFCLKQKVKNYYVKNQIRKTKYFDLLRNIPMNKIKTAIELFIYNAKEFFKKEPPGPIDILLFSGGYNLFYYNMLFTLLANKPELTVRTLTGSQSIGHELLLRKNKIHFIPLEKLNEPSIDQEVNVLYKGFGHYIRSHVSQKRMIDKVFPKQLPLTIRKALFFKVDLVLSTYARKSIKQAILAHRAVTHYRPKLMVTTHDPGPSALPFVLEAQANGIPTLVLLHGFHTMSFSADHKSDYIASWGKIHKKGFTKELQKKSHTVFSVGFPFLDSYFVQGGEYHKRPSVRKYTNDSPLRLGLLLTIYPMDQLARPKFLFDLFAAVSSSSLPLQIQLRVHAGQHVDAVMNLARHFGVDCVFNESITLDQYIKQNDVILSWDTTAILWAIIYGKPLLYTTPWWGKGWIPVSKYGAGWLVTSPVSLINKLTQLYHKPDLVKELHRGQHAFLKDTLGVTDGTSSEKLFFLLKKLSKAS